MKVYMTCLNTAADSDHNLARMYYTWLVENVGRLNQEWMWVDVKLNGCKYTNGLMFRFNRESDAVMFKLMFSQYAVEVTSVRLSKP